MRLDQFYGMVRSFANRPNLANWRRVYARVGLAYYEGQKASTKHELFVVRELRTPILAVVLPAVHEEQGMIVDFERFVRAAGRLRPLLHADGHLRVRLGRKDHVIEEGGAS